MSESPVISSALTREPIILASASASRRAMLAGAGVAFESVPAQIDERALEEEMDGAEPAEIAQALAAAKAAAVSALRPGALVLGSDSLVEHEGRRFNKPADRAEAEAHLRAFSGSTLLLHSAAALARDGQILWVGGDFARLRVRPLSDAFLAAYLDTEWPAIAGCVGCFRIEGPGIQLFDAVMGDHFTVLGMPLLMVLDALREEGALLA